MEVDERSRSNEVSRHPERAHVVAMTIKWVGDTGHMRLDRFGNHVCAVSDYYSNLGNTAFPQQPNRSHEQAFTVDGQQRLGAAQRKPMQASHPPGGAVHALLYR